MKPWHRPGWGKWMVPAVCGSVYRTAHFSSPPFHSSQLHHHFPPHLHQPRRPHHHMTHTALHSTLPERFYQSNKWLVSSIIIPIHKCWLSHHGISKMLFIWNIIGGVWVLHTNFSGIRYQQYLNRFSQHNNPHINDILLKLPVVHLIFPPSLTQTTSTQDRQTERKQDSVLHQPLASYTVAGCRGNTCRWRSIVAWEPLACPLESDGSSVGLRYGVETIYL